MNTPYALILTDSTHAPTVIGHYNSRQTIDEIRSAIRSYFTDDEPVLPTDIIPGTAQVLNECRAAIKAHHNHFVNLRSLALNDPYRIWQPELRQYAVTFYIPYAKCVTYFTAMSTIIAERIVQKTLESAKDVTAPCYVVTWPIIHPSAENEEDACDWSAPDGLTPHGEYDLERRYYY